jgi:3-methyladenine DNA glycosylase AlkD
MKTSKAAMPPKTSAGKSKTPVVPAPGDARSALAWLERHATKKTLDGMARYGMPSDKALGVTVGDIQKLAKLLGKSHGLAAELWKTGVYEARMLAAYVDEPDEVTAAQMDRWAKDFDNWGICDTVCFVLFDRAPDRWAKVIAWAGSEREFVKRAAFALLWGLTRHDKTAPDACFLQGLELIERAADDERHLVQKAVNMALRATGKRNPALRKAAAAVAKRLAAAASPAASWVGRDALRELVPKVKTTTRKKDR